MAHDGSYEVEWKGQPFSYLMHHPGFHKSENYGSARGAGVHGDHQPAAAQAAQGDKTGTWNGPAPTGSRNAGASAEAARPAVVKEPSTTVLSSGQRMPMIGLGTYQLETADAVKTALELGYRHFDCAAMYGNEAVVGAGLADFIAAGRRSELFITSKVWNTHHKPDAARASVLQSVKNLGLQQLDLVLMHWPEAWTADSDIRGTVTPDSSISLIDTWRGLEQLVDEGLVVSLGLSNCSLAQVEEVLAAAKHKPACNQIELHPFLAQRKLVGVSYRKGVVSVAHTCLCRREKDLLEHPVLQRVAAETGKTVNQVLLKYNMQRGVVVIPKATSREHLAENFVGMFDWRLSNQQKVLLDTLDAGKRIVDFLGKIGVMWKKVACQSPAEYLPSPRWHDSLRPMPWPE